MFQINQTKTAYFSGIGGIGISAIARIFLANGIKVFGSDLVESEITRDLLRLGAEIKIGKQVSANINKNFDLFIYTSAIPSDHPELSEAKKKEIKCLSYPEILAELVNQSYGIAITGTHGKTTTTAMLGKVLVDSGLDPTVVVGSNVKDFEGNAHVGKSHYFVFEACEYQCNFLHYKPKIAIVTNIEMDHPDCFKDIDDMRSAYEKFLSVLDKDNLFVGGIDSPEVQKVIPKLQCLGLTYSLKDKTADYFAQDVKFENNKNQFTVIEKGKKLEKFELQIAGEHNVLNALATITVARYLKVDLEKIKKSLAEFQGSWRRLSKRVEINGILILDDYAHHPTEVKVTLKAAKQLYPNRRLWCVYQPHHHDRTEVLFNDFIHAFDNADELLITDIYTVAGREEQIKSQITSKDLVDKIKEHRDHVYYQPSLTDTEKFLVKNLKKGDVCILMGAGNIYEIGQFLVNDLNE